MSSDCLFCRLVAEGDHVRSGDGFVAIRDINPRAPTHVLVIPKEHVIDGRYVTGDHGAALARMFEVAAELMRGDGLERRGYRIAFNVGEDAGMTIPHLHMHVLGGRRLGAEG